MARCCYMSWKYAYIYIYVTLYHLSLIKFTYLLIYLLTYILMYLLTYLMQTITTNKMTVEDNMYGILAAECGYSLEFLRQFQ